MVWPAIDYLGLGYFGIAVLAAICLVVCFRLRERMRPDGWADMLSVAIVCLCVGALMAALAALVAQILEVLS
jgi:hypothetical protein